METKNLELNIKYKYKAFCEVLDIEQKKSTNSKKAQLKELQQHMNIIKDGTWYTVTEIYDTPKEKIDGRGKSEGSRNNYEGIYAKHLDILVENRLYTTINNRKDKDNKTIYITNACLAELVKMVNFNYRICNTNREKFHKYMYTKYSSISLAEKDVLFYISSKLRPAISNALNKLQNEGKITYDSCYIIYYNNYTEKKASELQKTVIESAEAQAKKELKITDNKMLWNVELRKKFYDRCNELAMSVFNTMDETIEGYFQGYKINVIQVIKQENVKSHEQELNTIFSENVMKSINHKIESIKDGWGGIGSPKNEWDRKRTRLKYSKSIEHCIEVLISYNTNNITDEIKSMKTQKQIDIENNKLYEELKASGMFNFN